MQNNLGHWNQTVMAEEGCILTTDGVCAKANFCSMTRQVVEVLGNSNIH